MTYRSAKFPYRLDKDAGSRRTTARIGGGDGS